MLTNKKIYLYIFLYVQLNLWLEFFYSFSKITKFNTKHKKGIKALGQSPPHELEANLRSRPFLLVVLKSHYCCRHCGDESQGLAKGWNIKKRGFST